MLCETCQERDAHPLCNGNCVECSKVSFCERCERELENEGWEPGEERESFCESCRLKNEKEAWIEETKAAVMNLAQKHSWDFDRHGWGGFNTSSKYIELTRRCSFCRGDDDDADCECESIVVRVSDHASCYCREDISIARHPSADDHTLADLEKRLASCRKS